MDRAYYFWFGVFAFGGFLGLVFKLRVVGFFVSVMLGLLVVGFGIGALTGSELTVWLTGLALIMAPTVGAIMFAGAAVAKVFIGLHKRSKNNGHRDS